MLFMFKGDIKLLTVWLVFTVQKENIKEFAVYDVFVLKKKKKKVLVKFSPEI